MSLGALEYSFRKCWCTYSSHAATSKLGSPLVQRMVPSLCVICII